MELSDKRCTRCDRRLPAEENFYPKPGTADGLRHECKSCSIERKWVAELPKRQAELKRLEELPAYLIEARDLARIPYLRERITTLQERIIT